jgi:hypothetical protein
MDVVDQQLLDVMRRYPEARVQVNADGTRLLVVPSVPVASGWTTATATVLVLVPVGYPHVKLDCFYTESTLRLATGAEPASSNVQTVFGGSYRWFSWHLATWDATRSSLDQYVRFCECRLKEVR